MLRENGGRENRAIGSGRWLLAKFSSILASSDGAAFGAKDYGRPLGR